MDNQELKQLSQFLYRIAELEKSASPINTLLNNNSLGIAPKITCTPKSLPKHLVIPAAQKAISINPSNRPPMQMLRAIVPNFHFTSERIAIITLKRWHTDGVNLTVGFLDNPPTELRKRIIFHMNAWGKTANVNFHETITEPQVRIARETGEKGGYWSYLGTDILQIPANEQTMNLEAFSMDTPDSEFYRVVRHETGHTLGFPHEHMRRDLVNLIDENKAIEYFGATQGWTPQEVRTQVLTPIEELSLLGTPIADPKSIMCYQIPGTITKDGNPILGGYDIDQSDYEYAAKFYPKLNSQAIGE